MKIISQRTGLANPISKHVMLLQGLNFTYPSGHPSVRLSLFKKSFCFLCVSVPPG